MHISGMDYQKTINFLGNKRTKTSVEVADDAREHTTQITKSSSRL